MNSLLKKLAVFAAISLVALDASALTITTPISYTHTANNPIVGTFDPNVADANPTSVAGWLNTLLGLSAPAGPTTISGVEYRTGTFDYNGSVSADDAFRQDGGQTAVPAGYDWVVAKYNGENGGYVAWYLGGEAATLPKKSNPIWVNESQKGYDISNWTGFKSTSVPDGGATVGLLAIGLGCLALSARKRA